MITAVLLPWFVTAASMVIGAPVVALASISGVKRWI